MKKNLLFNFFKLKFYKQLCRGMVVFLFTLILVSSCKHHSNLPKQKEVNNSKAEKNNSLNSAKTFQKANSFLPVKSNKQNICPNKIREKESSRGDERIEKEADGIAEFAKYEFELQKNPITGTLPAGVFDASLVQARTLKAKENVFYRTANLNTYTPAGPTNLGGRTRDLKYDVRFATNRVIIAGCTSGGVMRSTNGGTSWSLVVGTNNIRDITCIAQDPRAGQQDTWYMGTGEYQGSSAVEGERAGYGVYKSTDNGVSWVRLATSNTGVYENQDHRSDFITRIVVTPNNGYVYIAATGAISRSKDQGATWEEVLSQSGTNLSPNDVTDIVTTSLGVLYAAFAGTTRNDGVDGVWKSSSGDAASWTRIGGNGSPTGWKTNGNYGRIIIALAPSNQNILYVMYDNKSTTTADCDFFKYDASANSGAGVWSANLTANLPNEGDKLGNFSTQQGYDMALTVKSDDPNFVIIGGTSGYASTNGFSTPNSYKRIGGYAGITDYTQYPNHHADIHLYIFEPGSNIKMISGDDGGIHVTNDVTAATVVWSSYNSNYQTYQYYYTAIDPTSGSPKWLGGAQDNGTTYRSDNTTNAVAVLSGDGASVGISEGNTFHMVSTQNGAIYRRDPNLGPGFATDIKPSVLGVSKGVFVTLFYLDPDNTENLYYANGTRLFRTTSASTVTKASGWAEITGVGSTIAQSIRSFATTRGRYEATNSLFMGTDGGKIFRLKDPQNTATGTVPDDITPAGMTVNSTVLGIATAPGNKDTVIAVVSNFSVPSIFWTGNATAASPTWYIVEGTGINKLDVPSFRSCAIVKKGNTLEYYAGTSVGLFSTTSIDGTSQATANNTSWVREGTGIIDYALVTSLPIRTSDNTMLVGTHGNGMYVTNIGGSVALPVKLTSVKAFQKNAAVQVEWTIEQEINMDKYEVERSSDGQQFFKIGSVLAKGYSSSAFTYNLLDPAPFTGLNYYRIKQLDKAGLMTYSYVVKVNITRGSVDIITVYPNPINGNTIALHLNDLQKGNYTVSISNKLGQQVFTKVIPHAGGFVVATITLPGSLAAGIYQLRLTGKGMSVVQKIMKN